MVDKVVAAVVGVFVVEVAGIMVCLGVVLVGVVDEVAGDLVVV